MKSIKLIAASLVLMLLWINPAMSDGLVVVVNKNNPMINISSSDLKKYYEGKMALWSDGIRVLPTDLADDNPLAAKFSETILNKSMEKKRRMWVKKVLRGDGTPPVQFNDDAGVVSYVASQPGAIGYVTADSVSDSVKIVTVDGQSRF